MENKTAKFVAHPSYFGAGLGASGHRNPRENERTDVKNRRWPHRIRELLVQTILIVRGQRFPPVYFRQWVSGIQPAGDGGEHRSDAAFSS